jgi:hypothetical protein
MTSRAEWAALIREKGCDQAMGRHLPFEVGIDSQDVLYEECPNCGYAVVVRKVSPEAAAAMRRAIAARGSE